MFRRNFRQGMAAVVFAAALALVSTQPAAAAGFGWREAWDWLSNLWGGVTFLQAGPAANGDCGLEIDPNGCPQSTVQGGSETSGPATNGDCGPEIDPDGCPRPTTGTGSGS